MPCEEGDDCKCYVYVELQDNDLQVNWWKVYTDENVVLVTWCMN